ncbi:MAG: hypothetical protein JF606_24375 [Burkholderiales bacterium]|nr:hypothetical protein [Burkholderiales bacterium]
MADIATYVRIFNAAPTDDFVEKRTAAIAELTERFGKKTTVANLLQLANGAATAALPKAKLDERLAEEVEASIKKHSTAFVRAGHDLEIIVCVLLGLLELLKAAKPNSGATLRVTDVLAAGLWSALAFQPSRPEVKIEALRVELSEVTSALTLASAEGARKRTKVPNFNVAFSEGGDVAAFNRAFKPGTESTIAALRANAILDREELDLLWWALGDWSELLGDRVSTLPPEVAAVTSGLELGRLLRKLPANAHRSLALRSIHAEGPPLNLAELLKALDGRRERLAIPLAANEVLSSCSGVFPLLTAIQTGKPTAPGAKEKRPLRDWGSRALLEASILFVLFDDTGT